MKNLTSIVKTLNTLRENGYSVITVETLKPMYWIRVNRIRKTTIRYCLNKLVKVGKLKRVGKGKYEFTTEITLTDLLSNRIATTKRRIRRGKRIIRKIRKTLGIRKELLDNRLREEYKVLLQEIEWGKAKFLEELKNL